MNDKALELQKTKAEIARLQKVRPKSEPSIRREIDKTIATKTERVNQLISEVLLPEKNA